MQVLTKAANPLIPSNVTATFSFTSPRAGNLTGSPACFGFNASGGAAACSAPACSPPGVAAPGGTVTCSYSCEPSAVRVRAALEIERVQFFGSLQNVTVSSATDAATDCVDVSAPLFAAYSAGAWLDPWHACANASRNVTTSAPPPAPGDCAMFTDSYPVVASAAASQGAAPRLALAAGSANATLPCPLPTLAVAAGFSITRSYNW